MPVLQCYIVQPVRFAVPCNSGEEKMDFMAKSISLLDAIALPAIFSVSAFAAQNNATDFAPAEKQGAAGGDRAPGLTNNRMRARLTHVPVGRSGAITAWLSPPLVWLVSQGAMLERLYILQAL